MATNFYLKSPVRDEIDIEVAFGVRITEVRGLNPPNPKEVFTRDWAAENGVDYYVPETRKFKSSDVTISFYAEDGLTTAISKYAAFCDYLMEVEMPIRYRDTLQNQVVNLIYSSNKPAWYQLFETTPKKLVAEITLLNPTGAVTLYVP